MMLPVLPEGRKKTGSFSSILIDPDIFCRKHFVSFQKNRQCQPLYTRDFTRHPQIRLPESQSRRFHFLISKPLQVWDSTGATIKARPRKGDPPI
jgi:hypothetical protein